MTTRDHLKTKSYRLGGRNYSSTLPIEPPMSNNKKTDEDNNLFSGFCNALKRQKKIGMANLKLPG